MIANMLLSLIACLVYTPRRGLAHENCVIYHLDLNPAWPCANGTLDQT